MAPSASMISDLMGAMPPTAKRAEALHGIAWAGGRAGGWEGRRWDCVRPSSRPGSILPFTNEAALGAPGGLSPWPLFEGGAFSSGGRVGRPGLRMALATDIDEPSASVPRGFVPAKRPPGLCDDSEVRINDESPAG